MIKPSVALVKFNDAYESLKEALQLSDGLGGLKKGDGILIKPNIVSWDFDLPFPPFGVVTTTAVISALVRILYEHGFTDLTIGESPLSVKPKGQAVFRALGYNVLQEKYGVKLVDFAEESYEPVDFRDFKLSIAHKALEVDKIINVPVLKTHNQAKVSLGIKNLKGCLDRDSRILCHGVGDKDLNLTFSRIIEKLPVALTIIDAVFALEKGPGHTGKAYRKNLLIASRDALAADLVGANLMGYSGEEVPHLKYFAERHGRSYRIEDVEIKGERIEEHKSLLQYDFEWTADNTGPIGFEKRGIRGIAVRKYDNTLCTGCSGQFNPMLLLLMSAFKGKAFPNIEVISGKKQLAASGFAKTILFGQCAYELNKDNPNIKKVIPVRGCPPTLKTIERALEQQGLEYDYKEYLSYRKYMSERYNGREGYDLALYTTS